jgi:hypothetical protein
MTDGPTSGILWLPQESHDAAVSQFSNEEQARLRQQELHDFPQPEPRQTIWRYLETYKFKDLLETETLYLCQVSRLQHVDPNEGLMNRFQLEAMRAHFKDNEAQMQMDSA